MPPTNAQVIAAKQRLQQEREQLARELCSLGFNAARFQSNLGLMDGRAKYQDGNLRALKVADMQLTGIRLQLGNIRRMMRSVEKLTNQQDNGVYIP